MRRKLKERTKILFLVFGCIFLLLLAAFLAVTQTKTLSEGAVSEDGSYTSVLADIANIAEADPRVVDLAMLGSHDASTGALSVGAPADESTGGGVKFLYAVAPGLSYRYTKTQVSTVTAQLRQGARFLHIKCAYHEGKWCGSHSMVDGAIEGYVREVISFLQGAKGEIVVLQFQIAYGGESTLSAFLTELFAYECEGHTLKDFVPYENVPLGELTYNTVTQNGTKGGAVVMFSGEDDLPDVERVFDLQNSEYRGKCYSRNSMTNRWYNRMKTSAIAEGVAKRCAEIQGEFDRYKNMFRVMQINTSPCGKDFFETVGAWSLVSKAKKHNAEMLHCADFDKWMETMPVVLCDFVTSANGGFNAKINQKIVAYNQRLVERLLAE